MKNTFHTQRGFAMAAMFIAVALLGGTVAIIEGPGLAKHYQSASSSDAGTATTNEHTEIDEILQLADSE